MGMGVSLILMAVGAVLAWAVKVDTEGVNVNTVGIILLIVGAVGLVLSITFWRSWGGYGPWRERTVVREDVYERPL